MWLGHSTQVFGQTPVGLSLWKYFLDEMNNQTSRLKSKADYLYKVGGPHPVSLKPLREKGWVLPWGRGISASRLLWTQAAISSLLWVSSLPAYPADFGLAGLHSHVNHSLEIVNLHLWFPLVLFLCRMLTYTHRLNIELWWHCKFMLRATNLIGVLPLWLISFLFTFVLIFWFLEDLYNFAQYLFFVMHQCCGWSIKVRKWQMLCNL